MHHGDENGGFAFWNENEIEMQGLIMGMRMEGLDFGMRMK